MKIEVHSPTIRRKEMYAVLTAMVEDKIGPGERHKFLLQTAKEYLHFDYTLVLRSPATALFIALKCLNLKEGDGVLISALSPRYYLNVLSDLGLAPIFCDVSFSFPCIDLQSIEKAISAKPNNITVRCILLHHTLGFIPDTVSINSLGIPVIEDISQSYSPQEEAPMPLHGAYTILGLEERDMLTSGGGALLFAMNRKEGNELRNYSNIPPEYSLPDMNAALAAVQFKEALRNAAKRRDISNMYVQAALRTRHKRFVTVNDTEYCNYAFALVLETGIKDVIAYARKKEIIVENAFEQTLTGAGASDTVLCPISYSLSLRTVLFPLYPRLASDQVQRVSKLIMTLP